MRRFIAIIAALALGVTGVSATAAPRKAKKTSSTAYASIVRTEGNQLVVAGYFVDKVLGSGTVLYRVQAVPATAPATVTLTAQKVTLYTLKGTLTGSGSATDTSNPDGTSTVTDGKVKLTKGTGAYKGHSLTATFTGTSANGVFTFQSTGTYR